MLGSLQVVLNASHQEQYQRKTKPSPVYQIRIAIPREENEYKGMADTAFHLVGFGKMTCHDLHVLFAAMEDLDIEGARLVNLKLKKCPDLPKIKFYLDRSVSEPLDITYRRKISL